MDLYEVMSSTPGTRDFESDPISEAALHRVLDHARFAPSGGNRQPWRVIVLRDRKAKRRLREQYVLAHQETPAYGTSGLDQFAEHLDEIPVLLLVCVELAALSITDRDLDRPSVVGGASIYPFVQNILLGLRTEGLGGILTTLVCPREPELRAIFGIPEAFAVACLIPVGLPRKPAPKLERRPVGEFAWLDRFGGEPFGSEGS